MEEKYILRIIELNKYFSGFDYNGVEFSFDPQEAWVFYDKNNWGFNEEDISQIKELGTLELVTILV